ncbi:MAG: hypothetical protein AAF438_02740 [Pseudomonadota bacterium]
MKINSRALVLWGFYFGFLIYAMSAYWHGSMFAFGGPFGALKLATWILLVGFLFYSIYCSLREDLFRTIGAIWQFHWGRQIGIDLYLGLCIGLLIIYVHEGLTATLIWLIPTLAFANLSMLLYVAMNFDSIVSRLALL